MDEFVFENLDQHEIDEFNDWLDSLSEKDMDKRLDEAFRSGKLT